MTDLDGRALVDETIHAAGAERLWHASQVRFGPNTRLPFGEAPARQHILQPGDAFFLDIGPVIDGHEGDVGRTFTLGGDGPGEALAQDGRDVWAIVADHWRRTRASGADLYAVAHDEAAARGRQLALTGAAGHRIGDFPHHIHHRGKLIDHESSPASDLWILEIHLIDTDTRLGAFHEDILARG
jgi:Xaa-Pro aminopeptidase